ncbi:protease inhibitor [Lithospermum erythrorhizon]|uniref:Protease inhibitor n=1 Tax=Lithospermum erythrorhizon TaxID=34254 RepID=A0AAV3PKF2_LITER
MTMQYVLEFHKSSFTMYFFLPNAKDGLPALLNKVSSESGFIDRHLPHTKVEVNRLIIPKFKIRFQFDASNVLRELGLVSIFSGGQLFVSSFFHKSFIESDFVADHPFLFVIRENKTGVLLFTAQILNPSS